ncbi:hypothetical protein XH84_32090 [Bradyrhizobium nanningense]|nr:hypothetical protein XH84_32090 [Bradyrhizobium nanningense]
MRADEISWKDSIEVRLGDPELFRRATNVRGSKRIVVLHFFYSKYAAGLLAVPAGFNGIDRAINLLFSELNQRLLP